MRPFLTVNRLWSHPERPAPNTQPHSEIPDPNNGNEVWARISSALIDAMWDDNMSSVSSLRYLHNQGMLNMTLDGQNLSSPFQVTLNISMHKYINTFPPF
jgi:hypothetical protein